MNWINTTKDGLSHGERESEGSPCSVLLLHGWVPWVSVLPAYAPSLRAATPGESSWDVSLILPPSGEMRLVPHFPQVVKAFSSLCTPASPRNCLWAVFTPLSCLTPAFFCLSSQDLVEMPTCPRLCPFSATCAQRTCPSHWCICCYLSPTEIREGDGHTVLRIPWHVVGVLETLKAWVQEEKVSPRVGRQRLPTFPASSSLLKDKGVSGTCLWCGVNQGPRDVAPS